MFIYTGRFILILAAIAVLLGMKTVLVSLGDNTRVVSFNSPTPTASQSALTEAVKTTFKDVLLPGRSFFFQLKSEDWGGVFLDLLPEDEIPDKSVMRAVLSKPATEVCFNLLCRHIIKASTNRHLI